MAHKKAGGSKARQKTRVSGKRLGLKVSGGQPVLAGSIITRQRGMKVSPGAGVRMGRDFTIFAVKEGKLSFTKKRGKLVASVK